MGYSSNSTVLKLQELQLVITFNLKQKQEIKIYWLMAYK